ncbi:phosphodiester glycosidase family protein [Paenibacillus sp. alder61]|uniref:Copper amine oxidase n=1 Tax=Paenibacillus faecis TaxID=862114 RepID=A0A5D0D477_9BACL|nr:MULTISPECIES: phosphodiester glycosidase family protein [Paenibacillus]MCA1293798.1 phosphodiester glycosidase family protein [Paenibacillus sp. alder61]TYA15385.1 copper amine oxidase [Paenibacillus faecis]
MKRPRFIPLLLLFLALTFLVPARLTAASAAAPKATVLIDGNTGRSFLPVTALKGDSEASLLWNESEKSFVITNTWNSVKVFVGQTSAVVNDAAVTLTDAPFRQNGTTYVPLQFLSQNLGYTLEWEKNPTALTLSRGDFKYTLPAVNRNNLSGKTSPVVSARKTFKVGNKYFPVKMITVSLAHPNIHLDVVMAGNRKGRVESLGSIAKRSKAIVAINGSYFDAYTKNSYKTPYGYIVSGGKLQMEASGDRRTVFTYNPNMLAGMIPGTKFNELFAGGELEGALQAGPRLVTDGKIALNLKGEGFRDPKILKGGGTRSALGLTRDNKLILLTTSKATIPQLAQIMKQAGAYQAMNLDGGASSGLYYNGKYLTKPGRLISNALVVKYQ